MITKPLFHYRGIFNNRRKIHSMANNSKLICQRKQSIWYSFCYEIRVQYCGEIIGPVMDGLRWRR